MKKLVFWVCVAVCCLGGSLRAQEPAFYAENFYNQHVINVNGMYGCQATHILPDWFLTAAHCVRPYCDKECDVAISVLDGELFAGASVHHTPLFPAVFIYPGFRRGDLRSSNLDVALIHMRPDSSRLVWLDQVKGQQLTRKEFERKVRQYPQGLKRWQTFINPPRVRLLTFTGSSARLKRQIAVPQWAGDAVYFYDSGAREVYFVEPLQHLLSANFGVERGMSGGGVLTHTGELAGVVSASLQGVGEKTFYNEEGEAVGKLEKMENYFMFTGFTGQTMNFIRNTLATHGAGMGGMGVINAYGEYSSVTGRSFNDIIKAVDTAQRR